VAARIGETADADKWIGGPDEAILRCMNEKAARKEEEEEEEKEKTASR
jgi:hypothetical protein